MLRIRQIMDQRNFTYREMAERMGVSPQYVASVVTERKNITLETVAKFAECLGVVPGALFDGYKDECTHDGSTCCPYCGGSLSIQKL